MKISHDVPTHLIFGPGSVCCVGSVVARLGKRVLLVAGATAMDSAGVTGRLIDNLAAHAMSVHRFQEFRHGPTTDDADRGATAALRQQIDVVVALGGGSALDCGKAIAAVMSTGASAEDLLYRRASVTEQVPTVVCVPTTAGTGSEQNRSAIVTDPRGPFKDGIRSDYLFPQYAIVDPDLIRSVPRQAAAQSGFDVLAHAIESFVSPNASPFCDELALEAMRRIGKWLPVLVADASHARAREQVARASTSMGVNLAYVGTCFPHRADKALCALRPDIPHGQSVALFYPDWLRSCHHAAVERFGQIAQIIDPTLARSSMREAASDCPEVIVEFIHRLGLSTQAREFQVRQRQIPQLVERVAGNLAANPVPLSREDLPSIFNRIFAGGRA